MSKIYEIEITGSYGHPNIWYACKVGKVIKVELVSKNNTPYFKYDAARFVHPQDCKIIGEYRKGNK